MTVKIVAISIDQTMFRVSLQIDDGLTLRVTLPFGDKPADAWTIAEIRDAARAEAATRIPS